MAVIRDEHGGPDAARLLSLAMLSLSVSPVLAPTLGGLLVQCASWRVIFAVLAFVTLAAALMVVRLLPETLPPARRVATGPRRLAVTYARLLADRRFLIPILLAGSGQSVLLLFISGSPFVLVTLHGLKPAVYGAVFAAHAMALIGISQFNAVLMQRFGVTRLLGAATAAMAIAAIALAGLVLAGMTALWPFLALTLFMFTCLGLVLAPAFLTALEPFGAIAGAASAIGVALELCLSSAATIALAWTGNGTARPLATLIALSATAAFTAWLAMVMRPAQPRLP